MLSAFVLAAAFLSSPVDDLYRAALDLLYDGSTETSILRLAALREASPQDPMGAYLGALALCWKIEQRPDSRALDADFHRLVDHAIALADARLMNDPSDVRALIARGAAHGVRSRLHLFRAEARPAARAAERMRTDLLAARGLDPENRDVLFGLGLYDYYVDVLPRGVKLLRFLLGMPGGDRRRGLQWIAEAREGSLFHRSEVEWQLYQIHAFYEDDPDEAAAAISSLRARYPEAPLWALQLADHRCHRLGLYAESGATAREILAAADAGHPNYSPVVAAMARLSLGESLLLDLRLEEAEETLRRASDGRPEDPGLASRAHLLLGRVLDLSGRRDSAEAHYRVAATSSRGDLRRQAALGLASPPTKADIETAAHLGEARRLREAGRDGAALVAYRAALASSPQCREAAAALAADDLRHGRAEAALRGARQAETAKGVAPPWVPAEARLVQAEALEMLGDRPSAVQLYKDVFKHPFGRAALRDRAAEALRRP
jgi:tetratricopeptide (TPR) repeat protein